MKVSGSASRLGSKNAYHHLTLLVNSDLSALKGALRKCAGKQEAASRAIEIESRATQSLRSPVANLADYDKSVTCEAVSDTLTEFVRQRFGENAVELEQVDDSGLTDASFAGIESTESSLRSHAWLFERNPSFSVKVRLQLPLQLAARSEDLQVRLDVEKCAIVSLELLVLQSQLAQNDQVRNVSLALQSAIKDRCETVQFEATAFRDFMSRQALLRKLAESDLRLASWLVDSLAVAISSVN
jgi:hypothetical protein